MDEIIALLRDKPNDFDLELFPKSKQIEFVKSYLEQYSTLPPEEVFCKEFQIEQVSSIAPWAFYENKLKEESFIKQAVPALLNFNKEYDENQKEALLHLREQLVSLSEPGKRMEPVSIVHDTSRYERFKQIDNSRMPTGIKPLDDVSGGLSIQNEFMIISARLGIGKSWVAHYIAESQAVAGYRVGIYSGEMSEDEVGARFDSLLSHVSNFALTRGKNLDLTEHLENLSKVKGDVLVLTTTQLKRNARPSDLRRFVKEYGIQSLIIDQLDLMEPDNAKASMSPTEQRALLSCQLKTLQQELRVPLIAVSQLNREAVQQEADASQLAGSDRFGRDATLIVALKRKETTLIIKITKARSFRIPEQPFEFEWNIDAGILESKLSAMDAVLAKVKGAKTKQAVKDAQAQEQTSTQEEDDNQEIW